MTPDINISDYVTPAVMPEYYIKEYPRLLNLLDKDAYIVARMLCDHGPVEFTLSDLRFILDNTKEPFLIEPFSANRESLLSEMMSRIPKELSKHTNVSTAFCIITVNPNSAKITLDELSRFLSELSRLIDRVYWAYHYRDTLSADTIYLTTILLN